MKQIMMLIIIMALFFTLAIGAFIAIYELKPELIGFAPRPGSKRDSTLAAAKARASAMPKIAPGEETIAISETKLKEMEDALARNLTLLGTRDSLNRNNRYLSDSVGRIIKKINELNWTINNYKDSVQKSKKSREGMDKFALSLQDSIAKLRSETQKMNERLKLANKRVEDSEKFIGKKQDSLEKKNFAEFAKIYNMANPVEVARILEQIDERDAAKVLKLMQKKKAGKVLDAMKAEHSAAILLLGGSGY